MKEEKLTRLQLLELKDPSSPLLKKLRLKAPGTYFHSLIVSELAGSAALHFPNADPLLAQVGGLYHDIGKISTPEAYAENQEDANYPFEPEVILTHVEKSIEMAKAFSLPEEIQRFMATHHGTQNAPQLNKDQNNLYPRSFRPQTTEETLVMLADSSEAAVRSSKKSDRVSLMGIVRSVFEEKTKNDQLRDSVIILHDLKQIEEAFVDVFVSLYHRRHATEDFPEKQIEKNLNEDF